MGTPDMNPLNEAIFDIAFNFGHRLHSFDKCDDLMEMLEGSRGLKDRVVAWAQEFDTAWRARAEGKREEYLGEIDAFTDKKWRGLLAELSRFGPATSGKKPLAIVAVQVVPYADNGNGNIDALLDGPTDYMTGWAIYFRMEDGTAQHVADVGRKDGYDTAMLMGRALAIEHLVQIEHQSWAVLSEVEPPQLPFRVSWEIGVYATSPREAAEMARGMQQEPDSTASVFSVILPSGKSVQVDLSVPA